MSDGSGSTTEQQLETRIGTLAFTHDFAGGYPTRDTVEKLYDERDFQRACQAYLYPTRGARRRRKPTILTCLHQMANPKATAMQERTYANRGSGLTTEQLIYRGRSEGWLVVPALEPEG